MSLLVRYMIKHLDEHRDEHLNEDIGNDVIYALRGRLAHTPSARVPPRCTKEAFGSDRCHVITNNKRKSNAKAQVPKIEKDETFNNLGLGFKKPQNRKVE